MREESQREVQPGEPGRYEPGRSSLSGLRSGLALALALLGLLAGPGGAEALIDSPITLDGPSSAISDLGGVSMASDGSGGLVYVKAVEGTPHVFACRFLRGEWGAPIRVDAEFPYEASQPAIVAGPKGELLVVWVTQVATVKGGIRYGLYSARMNAGSHLFGSPLPVDANVAEGKGVAPSLSATSPSKAIVAYRVVTDARLGETENPIVPLHPGDVAAEIRVARFNGERWSSLGPINRSTETSMRPPTPTNGPQVGTGITGAAVVAWQEPDETGAARVYLRRVFGTTPGPILEASPTKWEGQPVSADVDAFSLAVSDYAMARVAFRVARTGGSALAGRVLINTLPPTFSTTAGVLVGPQLVDGVAASPVGPPDVALAEDSARKTSTRLAFLAGARPRQLGGQGEGPLSPLTLPAPPPGQTGAAPVVTADPTGGGLIAYAAADGTGSPVVAVRQEFASGAAQTGLLGGSQGGPISELAVGRSGNGDGLVTFLQGEAGRHEVVADRISAPPAPFKLKAPKRWIGPRQAKLKWQAARTAVGGLTYSVLVDGRVVKRGLRRLRFRIRPAQLGNGVQQVRVLASDELGEQLLTRPAKLKVDGQAPTVQLAVRRGKLRLRVRDPLSGLKAKATRVRFGDGSSERGGSSFVHDYPGPGRFRVTVRARDAVGNRVLRHFEVRIG